MRMGGDLSALRVCWQSSSALIYAHCQHPNIHVEFSVSCVKRKNDSNYQEFFWDLLRVWQGRGKGAKSCARQSDHN